ncbi:MAG: uracil-DNA glycosylase [Chloroflexi bacterium]|nr:uracil-DNA glycosylase [Chloroflexota bacterium]
MSFEHTRTTPSADDNAALLSEVAAEVARCQACVLYKHALKPVPGDGDPNAAILFIGEAPGRYENQQGKPFVGAAGQFLEDLLRSIGLRRDQVFIANVVKHWPPGNRDPLPEEIATCGGFLDRQIEIINPQVIVTLGRFSMAKFFPGERISRIHGVARRHRNRMVLPLYHPAAALHQANLRRTIEEDFKRIPAALAEAEKLATPAAPIKPPEPAQTPEPPPQQLSLF